MPRRLILSATERDTLLALPESQDDLIRYYTFNDSDLSLIRQRRGDANRLGVVCGRGRNPTLRLWPAIFSGEIDVFPSERRNMGQEIGR